MMASLSPSAVGDGLTQVFEFCTCSSCSTRGGSHCQRSGRGLGNHRALLQTISPGPRTALESGAGPSDRPVAGWTSLKYSRELLAGRVSHGEAFGGVLSLHGPVGSTHRHENWNQWVAEGRRRSERSSAPLRASTELHARTKR